MKIIKTGILPKKQFKKFRGTCQICHCQIEVNENECREILNGIYWDGKPADCVQCPTEGCNAYIKVEEYIIRKSNLK